MGFTVTIIRFGELKTAFKGFVKFIRGLVSASVLGNITLENGMLGFELFKEL